MCEVTQHFLYKFSGVMIREKIVVFLQGPTRSIFDTFQELQFQNTPRIEI
jgi:hypothetical protein